MPPKPQGRMVATASPTAEEVSLLAALKDALDRNTQEIETLKTNHAKELETLRRQNEAQQQQIQLLQQKADLLAGPLAVQAPAGGGAQAPAAAGAQAPGAQAPAAGGQAQPADELARLRQRIEVQQRQMEVLEQQARLLADQVGKQSPVVDRLQGQAATLESRAQQAAQRDQEISNAIDSLTEQVDTQRRTVPYLPPTLKELFLPSQTNETPLSIYNTFSTNYNLFNVRKGAGTLEFGEFTPFFLLQLNKRFLLSAETGFDLSGASLGQAQMDIFINNWLTMDIGYFLAPIGFWSERLDPGWINKLPDIPLVLRQVIPDGLATTGLQLRGAQYLFRSPVKMEYSTFITNGLGVPGMGTAADFTDVNALSGTTSSVNSAMAYGGRLGLWIPSRGINFGVSEFVNAPYSATSGIVMSIWQPYFNYHYRNIDFRFEYGNMWEKTLPFIGHNIRRNGLYAQIAYRNYASLNPYLQRLEAVFRFSYAHFHGIDQAGLDPTAFGQPMDVPVNRNQYTMGINYYFYPSTMVKFAYEINQEVTRPLRDNLFMAQFATNF